METFLFSITAVVIILIVVFLIFLKRKNHRDQKPKSQYKLKEEILKEDLNFDNIIKSSFHAKHLYDKLKVICHPDLFLEPKKNEIATELFQKITENENDYAKLLEIEAEINEKLLNL